MIFVIHLLLGALATVYLTGAAFVYFTKYPDEPTTIDVTIPFLSPIIGLVRKKWRYYNELRDIHRLPILTLRLPQLRLYIVNTISLFQAVQKQSTILAMPPLEAKAMLQVLKLTKPTHATIMDNIDGRQGDWGFMFMFYKTIHPPLAATSQGLHSINQISIRQVERLLNSYGDEISRTQGLFALVKDHIVSATSDAVYGSHNPFRDADLRQAYWEFEPGIVKLLLGLNMFARQTILARDKIANAFEDYFRHGHHLQGSALIQAHFDHAEKYGLPLQDLAQLEVAAALGVLSNIVPTTFWLLYHLYSSPSALSICRSEIDDVTRKFKKGDGTHLHMIDVSEVKSACPTLLSCFKETLRLHTVGASARMVMEDMTLSSTYFLRKGGIVLLPQQVLHTDEALWGQDVGTFSPTRFLGRSSKRDPVAFRGFGGGTTLCPGRHFATTEVLAYTALFIMRFEMEPENGQWLEPTTEKAGIWTVTTGPDTDVYMRTRTRDGTAEQVNWQLTLSESDHIMELVAEDRLAARDGKDEAGGETDQSTKLLDNSAMRS